MYNIKFQTLNSCLFDCRIKNFFLKHFYAFFATSLTLIAFTTVLYYFVVPWRFESPSPFIHSVLINFKFCNHFFSPQTTLYDMQIKDLSSKIWRLAAKEGRTSVKLVGFEPEMVWVSTGLIPDRDCVKSQICFKKLRLIYKNTSLRSTASP